MEEKQSPCSPGAVLSEETLLRIVYYPSHIDDNGKLKPEAIPTQDLRTRGFSVFRKLYIKRKKIDKVIDSYVGKNSERRCKGIYPIICSTVRNIEDNSKKKAFNVLDDAQTFDNEAHAEIKYSQKYTKSEQKGLRDKLKDKFIVVKEVSEICEELSENNKNWLTRLLSCWWNKFTGKYHK